MQITNVTPARLNSHHKVNSVQQMSGEVEIMRNKITIKLKSNDHSWHSMEVLHKALIDEISRMYPFLWWPIPNKQYKVIV